VKNICSKIWYNLDVIGEGLMGQFIGSFGYKNNALGGRAGMLPSVRFLFLCKGFNDLLRVKAGLSGAFTPLGV